MMQDACRGIRIWRAGALALAPVLALAATLAAERPAAAFEGPSAAVELHGDLRVRAAWLSPLPLDAAGTLLGQDSYAEDRLRISPSLVVGKFEFHGELDLFDGVFAGTPTIPFDHALRPRDRVRSIPRGEARYLYAVWNAPIARLQAGLMGSRWGLGLLASDGTGPGDDFGDDFHGDRSLRALVATRPILLATKGKSGAPLALALAADMVIEDETARFSAHDRAFEGVAALLWSAGPDGKATAPGEGVTEAGAYVVYRALTDAAGGKLGVLAADLYGMRRIDFSGGTALTLAAEGVLLTGGGTIARSLSAPDGHKLLAGGAIARGTLTHGPIDAILELGYASGDANTEDDRINSFKFDPDFNVGLLMFEEALAWQTARSADLLADPDLVGKPPNGVGLLPTNGSVTNAFYVNPRARIRAGNRVEVRAGVLWAMAPLPVVDPYNTFRNGGVARSYLGGPPGRSYGLETDLAVHYKIGHGTPASSWSLQGGLLLPGRAFAEADGTPMPPAWEVLLRLYLGW